jgi:RNA polymerase sigma factor (sigma-70 family)
MSPEEFKIQVLPLKHRLYRFALRMLGKEEEAKDSVQEVFVKLWTNRDNISKYKSVEALAMTITRNYCLDRIKSKQFQTRSLDRHPVEIGGNSQDYRMELSDTIGKVHQIIAALPEQQKMIIQLRDIEGLEFEEIASILEININAVRVNLSRARKKVRDTLVKIQNYELAGN